MNFDVRELEISGVVRASDIDALDEVTYDKIAEARINYGGHGQGHGPPAAALRPAGARYSLAVLGYHGAHGAWAPQLFHEKRDLDRFRDISSIPASIYSSRLPLMACAVMATIRTSHFGDGIARICLVASIPVHLRHLHVHQHDIVIGAPSASTACRPSAAMSTWCPALVNTATANI